jgi:hypothetical protein
MANVLGSLQINIDGNTASFTDAMTKAEAKAKASAAEIKRAIQQEIKESNASLALMGEEFGVHLPRHVRTFVSSLPGISKAMATAFTGLAVVAIGDALVKAGEKAFQLAAALSKLSDAAKKNADQWRGLQLQQQQSNDQLDLTNAKLEVEIAKLEHKPVNSLKVSIDEARVAADQLAASLHKGVEEEIKLLKEQEPNWFVRFLTGQSGTGDIQKLLDEHSREMSTIAAGGNLGESHDVGATQTNTTLALRAQQLTVIAQLQKQIADANVRNQSALTDEEGRKIGTVDTAPLQAVLAAEQQKLVYIDAEIKRAALTAKVNDLRDKNTNVAPVSPVTGALAMAQAQYDNSLKMLAVSRETSLERQKQLALDKADLEIARLQKEIAEHNAKGGKQLPAMSAGDQQKLRDTFVSSEMNAQATKLNETLADGTRTITLRTAQENALAMAIRQGAEAVQQANAQAQAENELKNLDASAAEIAARAEEILAEAKAKAHVAATQSIQDKSYELEAQRRLTAAYLQGVEATRLAELQNKIAAINRSAASPADKSAQIQQATLQSQLQLQENIAKAAGQAANAEKDRITFLQQTLAALKTMDQAAPEVSAAIKQTSKEIVELQDKMAMATGLPMAGMRSFFDEMSINTRTAAQEVNDVLGKAFEGLNDQMAKALTGQKTNWKGMFEGLSTSTAKSAMKQGEGAITKALGFGGKSKRGDSAMMPMFVQVVGGMPGGGGATSDFAGGGLLHSLGIPGFAAGGDPNPYGLSVVGEDGPELHSNLGGHITSNSDLRSLLRGGDTFHIDARGTNAAEVETRVRRAIAESHVASVHSAVAAQRELQARRPPKTKGAY